MVVPLHAHVVAQDICENGTSKRRYDPEKLVEVPESTKAVWLATCRRKANSNPLLANFEAMSHTGRLYACLKCTHFVEGQKLVAEGSRRYNDQPDGVRFVLREDDVEGRMIQEKGVLAIVYSEALWTDTAALLAVMREDNLDADWS